MTSLAGDAVHLSCALSTDVDEQAALLGDWTQRYQQLSSGPFIGSLRHAQFGRTQLFRETTSQRVHEVGTAGPESLVLAVARSTVSEPVRWSGRAIGASDVAIFPGDAEFDIVLPAECTLHAVAIDLAEFSRYAQDLSGNDGPCHFTRSPQVLSSPHQQTRFTHFLEASLQAVIDKPHGRHLPQVQKALREGIHAHVFEMLDARVETTATLSPTKRFALVAEVRHYVNEHPDAVPSVAEICRAFGVSRRSLQYAFEEAVGVNPVSYLRALRLNAVHRAIKEAGESTSVLEIAARRGFWHPSYFSASYRQLFGESPSMTQRRHSIRGS